MKICISSFILIDLDSPLHLHLRPHLPAFHLPQYLQRLGSFVPYWLTAALPRSPVPASRPPRPLAHKISRLVRPDYHPTSSLDLSLFTQRRSRSAPLSKDGSALLSDPNQKVFPGRASSPLKRPLSAPLICATFAPLIPQAPFPHTTNTNLRLDNVVI